MARKIDCYPIPTNCPYCGSEVVFTSNKVIYGKEYGNGKCYKCTTCDAYVGVHNGTNIPLGRLANKELRELKKQAHALFDPIWQTKKKSRSAAYRDLALALDIPKNECHFGWFDKPMLLQAIAYLQIIKQPNQLLITIFDYLKKDFTLTDKNGIAIIHDVLKTVREGIELSETQMADIRKQYVIIKTNADKKHATK